MRVLVAKILIGVSMCVVAAHARSATNKTFKLTVSASPSGAGTVTPTSSSFPAGQQVTNAAKAATDYIFVRWSGDCSGSGACKVTLNADKNVVAEFKKNSFSVSTSVSPAGVGAIKLNPAGSRFTAGTKLSASSSALNNYFEFQAWGGACSGSGACTPVVNNDLTISANFHCIYDKYWRDYKALAYSLFGTQASSTSQPIWDCWSAAKMWGAHYTKPYYGGLYHPGVDYTFPTGTSIISPIAGVVQRVDISGVGNWTVNSGTTCGQIAIRDDRDGMNVILIHLSKQFVLKGERVAKGEVIGEVGQSTANGTCVATGPHLHVERRTSDRTGAAALQPSVNGVLQVTLDPTAILTESEKLSYSSELDGAHCSGCAITPFKTYSFSVAGFSAYSYSDAAKIFLSNPSANLPAVFVVYSEDAPASALFRVEGLTCNQESLAVQTEVWQLGLGSVSRLKFPYPMSIGTPYEFRDSSGRRGLYSVCSGLVNADRQKIKTVELLSKPEAYGGRVIYKTNVRVN